MEPTHLGEQESSLLRGLREKISTLPAQYRAPLEQEIACLQSRLAACEQQARAELYESRQALQLFVEYAPAAIAMFDRQMRYIAASRRYLADYHITVPELIGRSHYEIFPEIPERWKEIHNRCLAGASESCAEDPFPREDGALDWVRWEIHPWYDHQGEVGGIILFSEVITERKKAAEQLNFQSRVLENVRDSIIVADSQMRVTYWNKSAEELYGYSSAEALGRTSGELTRSQITPEQREAILRELYANGQYEVEVAQLNRAGEQIIVAGRLVTLTGPGGETTGYIASNRDVTRARAAEIALAESEERFRLVWEIAADAMSLSDAQGTVIAANPAYYRLYGYSPEQVLGHNFAIIYPKDARAAANQRYQAIFHAHTPAVVHHATIQRADGVTRFVDSRIGFIEKNGQRTAMLSLIRDISEEVEREQMLKAGLTRLKENEQRFQVALSSLNLMVFSCDRELRYTWIYHPRSGREIQKMLNQRDDELIPGEPTAEIMALKRLVLETGQKIQRELHVPVTKNQTDFLINLEPMYAENGEIIGILGAMLDITQQRQLEAQHRQVTLEREVHHRLMEFREKERQGIARELHDGPIQTLSSLAFQIQIVKEAFENPSLRYELDQLGQKVKGSVSELRDLVNQLRPPSLIRFGLTKTIQMHAEEIMENHSRIEIHLDLAEDGGILSEQACLNLFRIYQEALTNVLNHSGATQVWVTYRCGDGSFLLELRDNGRGFAASNDYTDLTSQGHFGLAGMKERADILGGELCFSSSAGMGAQIRVTGPLNERNLR